MVESQIKINGRSDQFIFQNTSNSDHDPSSNDQKILYNNSDMDLDINLEDRILFRNIPGISGGCIISERPIFLKNSILCVINNRKCSLFNSKDGNKICDTYSNPEMIIGCRSFMYDNKYEILICASSDGTILGYNVPNGLGKDLNLSDLLNIKLDVTFELIIECRNLLAIETNGENGDVICVILNKDLSTEVIKFTIDYSRILFTECDNINDSNRINNTSNKSNKIHINTNNHGHTYSNGDTNGNNNSTNNSIMNETSNGYHSEEKIYNGFKSIISVDINLEIFEIDNRFSKIAIGAGKSCLVVDLKTEQCFYFENDQIITCIAFDDKGTLTIGDTSGQITILSLFSCVNLFGKGQISMFVSNTSSTPVLSFSKIYNNIDFTKLSHNLNDPTSGSNANNSISHGSSKTSTSNNSKDNSSVINHNGDYRQIHDQDKGRIEMIRGKVEAKRLHWHSHGVNCICYSKKQLLSAGEEGVVVLWDLETQSKKFVTRLGTPIFHIGVAEDKRIFASLQNNSIALIDSISLSVYAKISSLSMNSGIFNYNSEESRIVKYFPELNEVKDINPNRINNTTNKNNTIHNNTNNHGHTYSNGDTNGNNKNKHNNIRDKIIIANNNKLQVYNYVEDCESKLIDVSNVHYVSRQDEEFGQNYQITNLCVSRDSRHILVVQSRSVNTASPEDEMELSEDRKYILKFYHLNNNNKYNEGKDNKSNNKEKEKNIKDEDDYVLHTNISNPHRKKITGLKQLNKRDKFISTSIDGKLNIYCLVKVTVDGTSITSTSNNRDNRDKHYNEIIGKDMWICSHSIDYKEMPIYSLTINENNMIMLRHEMVLSLWKYSDDSDKELSLLKGLVNPLGNDLLFIKFMDNETLLLCTKKEVYVYSIRNGLRNMVVSLKGDEEINGIVFKYDLLIMNIRKYAQNNFVNIIEVYDVKRNFSKIYSKIKTGVNSQLSIQLVPSPIEVISIKDNKIDKKNGKNKEERIEIKENIEEGQNNIYNKEETENGNENKQEIIEIKENSRYKRKREDEEKDGKEKLSKWIFGRNDKHYNILILNNYSNEIEVVSISKIEDEYIIRDFCENNINFKKLKKENEEMNFLYKFINDMIESGRNKRKENNNNNKGKNKEKKKRFSIVSKFMGKNKVMPKINSILDIVDERYPSTHLPSPNVIIDQMMKKLML